MTYEFFDIMCFLFVAVLYMIVRYRPVASKVLDVMIITILVLAIIVAYYSGYIGRHPDHPLYSTIYIKDSSNND